jgi:hypothetical protein
MAYTPIARAIQSTEEPFRLANRNKPTQTLMPSPSFHSMSKVRTLQTEVSRVTIVRLRLGASPRDGVPGLIPVFPGLQTGSSSLSPACQVSLGVLGETPALPAFRLPSFPAISSIAVVCFHGALTPPCGVPASGNSILSPSTMPVLSHPRTSRAIGWMVLSFFHSAS